MLRHLLRHGAAGHFVRLGRFRVGFPAKQSFEMGVRVEGKRRQCLAKLEVLQSVEPRDSGLYYSVCRFVEQNPKEPSCDSLEVVVIISKGRVA